MARSIRFNIGLLAFLSVLFVVLTGSLVALFLARGFQEASDEIENNARGRMATLTIESHFNLVSRIARNIMLGSDIDSDLKRYDKSLNTMKEQFAVLRKTAIDAKDANLIETAENATMNYVRSAYAFCQALRPLPKEDRVAEYDQFGKTATPLAEQARKDFSTILDHKTELYASSLVQQQKDLQQELCFAMALAVVLGGICALLAWRLMYAIGQPLAEVTRYAHEVSQRKPARLDPSRYAGELRILAESVGAMVEGMSAYTSGVLNSLPMPAMLLNIDGQAEWWNAKLTGLTGRKVELSQAPVDPLRVLGQPDMLAQLKRTQREARSCSGEISFADGREAQYETALFRDDRGKLLGVLLTCTDISQIRHQQALAEATSHKLGQLASNADGSGNRVQTLMDTMGERIEDTMRHSEQQYRETEDVSQSIEALTQSIERVSQKAGAAAQLANATRETARQGAKVVSLAVQSIEAVDGQARELAADMSSLNRNAEDIGKILRVISDIADQTNLLALNAAIEAARAGEAGRGFAVVADEVRKLAEKTMAATSEVDVFVASIQQNTQKSHDTVQSTVNELTTATSQATAAGEALKRIVSQAGETADSIGGIASATEEQSAASSRINASTAWIKQASDETVTAMTNLEDAVQELGQQSSSLLGIIAEMGGKRASPARKNRKALTQERDKAAPAGPSTRSVQPFPVKRGPSAGQARA